MLSNLIDEWKRRKIRFSFSLNNLYNGCDFSYGMKAAEKVNGFSIAPYALNRLVFVLLNKCVSLRGGRKWL